MVGFGIAGREKSAAVWEPVCKRRGQVRERDDKKGSKPGRMARAPEGDAAVPATRAAWGRNGREGARRVWWGESAANEPETRSAGKKREVLGINGRNPAGHYTLLDTT